MLTVFAWIFFRAENIGHAFHYIAKIFSTDIFSKPEIIDKKLIFLIIIFLIIEWLGRRDKFAIEFILLKIRKPFRICFYFIIVNSLIYFFINSNNKEFIYFQI